MTNLKKNIGKTIAGLGIVLGASLSQACKLDYLFYPSTPEGAIQIQGADTLSVYRGWLEEMKNCSGRNRNFDEIGGIFMVPGYDFPCPNGNGRCFGSYYPPTNSVYISESKILVPEVGKYELGHFLGISDDSREYEKCGLDPSSIYNGD
jgi:hypothetical protein